MVRKRDRLRTRRSRRKDGLIANPLDAYDRCDGAFHVPRHLAPVFRGPRTRLVAGLLLIMPMLLQLLFWDSSSSNSDSGERQFFFGFLFLLGLIFVIWHFSFPARANESIKPHGAAPLAHSLPRLRDFKVQFTMGGMLVFFTACGVVLSLVGWQMRHASENKSTRRRVTQNVLAVFDGSVRQSILGSNDEPTMLVLNGSDQPDQALRHDALRRFKSLHTLTLVDTGLNDRAFERVSKVSSLRDVTMRDEQVTDAGLAHVVKLENLKRLVLVRVPVSDRSVETLSRLRGLYLLILEDTNISPKGLEKLRAVLPNCSVREKEYEL
jgi:hypothetical protein